MLNKNLTASESFEIVLDNYDAKQVESKKENSSLTIAN